MIEAFQNLFAPPRHMILLVIAAWLGLTLAERRAERHGIGKDDLNNITFNGLIAFIIGGRLLFILQNLAVFTKKPLDIVSINPDLFDPFGALAFALVAAIVYGQRKRLAFWNSLDALTPFFAVLAFGLGLSHLAEGAALGTPTKMPWGIELRDAIRHPISIYETLASLLTLSLLWFLKQTPRPGIFFLLFAVLTALSQLFLQAFHANSAILLGGYKSGQVLAWVALAVCFILTETRLAASNQRE
jgi:phosphatidylglycerol:prolipoprotein diacylglycerol transferase